MTDWTALFWDSKVFISILVFFVCLLLSIHIVLSHGKNNLTSTVAKSRSFPYRYVEGFKHSLFGKRGCLWNV